MSREFNIDTISASDYTKEIKNIVEIGLGSSYANNVKSLETPSEKTILLVAKIDGEPVGFACSYNSNSPEDYINYLDEDLGAKSIIEKISVHPDYRGKGIGAALYEQMIKFLEQPTIVDCWVRTESPDSTYLSEKFGFKEHTKIENRWLKESESADDDNFCPDCGKICKCDSAVYILY